MRALTWLLIVVLALPAAHAAPSRREPGPAVGVVRLGSPAAEPNGTDPARLRLERWLDGRPGVRLATDLDRDRVARELRRARAEEALSGFYATIESSAPSAREVQALERAVAALEPAQDGPWIQRIQIALADHHWRRGDREAAEAAMERSLRAHPEGRLEISPDWDWDEGAVSSIGIEETARRLGRNLRRLCRVKIAISPAGALATLDGFPVRTATSLHLIAGKHLLRVEHAGRERSRPVSCSRFGAKTVTLSLPERPRAVERERSLAESFLVLEESADSANLLLFTPGHGVDVVPTTRPLRVGELAELSTGDLPIASDAFSSLLSRHRIAASDLAVLPAPLTLEAIPEPRGKRWYNDWRVWAIAGGVVGTALIVLLSTKNQHSVATNPSGIRIQLD